MFTLKQVLLLAIAGTAIAAPAAHRHRGEWDGPFTGRLPTNQNYDQGTDTKTITIVTYGGPTQTSGGDAETVTIVPYTGGSDGQDQGSDSGSSTPAPTSTAAPSTDSGSDTGYMAIVNAYRKAAGLAAFTQSSKLEANALKTCNDGNGQMKHELNPGTMGQVLAPGNANNFKSVFIGGWLCEIPSLPGLNGQCPSMTGGWDHSNGETGHAKILSSTSYTQIGCALAKGIWGCDLA